MASLKIYNSKRNFSKTHEPKGVKAKPIKKLRFVVQHHKARRDHYDLRLELEGVLLSWAVPKGPSYDTSVKRLAVEVENHPLSYRNFEGTIPKGQYGGGTVQLWDKGFWIPKGNPKESLKKGNLKFELRGSRLKGKWALVHYKDDNWLLIKELDSSNLFNDITKINTSIKTGRTMEEIEKNLVKKKVKNSKKENIVEGITISNPQKIIYNKEKISKMDIAYYYQKVSKRMLPLLKNRIISTVRSPLGTNNECFFKKHFENDSAFLGQIDIPKKNGKKEDYYYIKDTKGIIEEVQMNGYEFHVCGSKVDNLDHPNVLVFDLDPDEKMDISKIREGVRDLKSVLDEFKVKSFLKTSGGKGYHVVVPIKKIKNWEEFRNTAQNIAKLMENRWPNKYVSNMRKDKRKGKIFIDWIRNTKGATSVAPYSLRTRRLARVSMPIKWSELDKVKPDDITMEEAIKRLKRKDPWEGFNKLC